MQDINASKHTLHVTASLRLLHLYRSLFGTCEGGDKFKGGCKSMCAAFCAGFHSHAHDIK